MAAHSDILIGTIDAIESFMSIVWWTSLNMDWMLIHISLLQSRQIIFPKKIGARTDLLWADWGIHHFHLTKSENLDENGFCKRSDFLLFAIVRNDCVYFLDVK